MKFQWNSESSSEILIEFKVPLWAGAICSLPQSLEICSNAGWVLEVFAPLPHKQRKASARSAANLSQIIMSRHCRNLGSSQTWLFLTWLLQFLRGSALLRPFALFCGLAFALFCAQSHSFAHICVFLRPTAFRTTAFGNFRESTDAFKAALTKIGDLVQTFGLGLFHLKMA